MLLSPLYPPYGTWFRYIYGTPLAQKIGSFRNILGTYYNIVFLHLSIVLCLLGVSKDIIKYLYL